MKIGTEKYILILFSLIKIHSLVYREGHDLPKIKGALLKFVYPVPDDVFYDFLLVVASHTGM
jgi:hypothetical protein